jgi:predicted DNA-binding transcriptional regulator AlpA
MTLDMRAPLSGQGDGAQGVPAETDADIIAHRGARVEPLSIGRRDVPRVVGVSGRTWDRLVATGRAPRPVCLGRRKVWPVAELRAWLAAGAPPRNEWDILQRARRERP